jgi:hypothetical protein
MSLVALPALLVEQNIGRYIAFVVICGHFVSLVSSTQYSSKTYDPNTNVLRTLCYPNPNPMISNFQEITIGQLS